MTNKFQSDEDSLIRMASNIAASDDIDACIIITMDKNDLVNSYAPNVDDDLFDAIMVAGLGEDALDKILRYMNMEHLKLFIDPEELEKDLE